MIDLNQIVITLLSSGVIRFIICSVAIMYLANAFVSIVTLPWVIELKRLEIEKSKLEHAKMKKQKEQEERW